MSVLTHDFNDIDYSYKINNTTLMIRTKVKSITLLDSK